MLEKQRQWRRPGRAPEPGSLQKRIRKLHLSSQEGFHRLACSAFNCLWDSLVERYTNGLPQRKRRYQIFSTRERKGFKLVARRTEARPFLTPRGGPGSGERG